MFRNSVSDLDTLSSTDMKCQWTKLKEPSLVQYKPVPINQFDCYKEKESKKSIFGEDVSNSIR